LDKENSALMLSNNS